MWYVSMDISYGNRSSLGSSIIFKSIIEFWDQKTWKLVVYINGSSYFCLVFDQEIKFLQEIRGWGYGGWQWTLIPQLSPCRVTWACCIPPPFTVTLGSCLATLSPWLLGAHLQPFALWWQCYYSQVIALYLTIPMFPYSMCKLASCWVSAVRNWLRHFYLLYTYTEL